MHWSICDAAPGGPGPCPCHVVCGFADHLVMRPGSALGSCLNLIQSAPTLMLTNSHQCTRSLQGVKDSQTLPQRPYIIRKNGIAHSQHISPLIEIPTSRRRPPRQFHNLLRQNLRHRIHNRQTRPPHHSRSLPRRSPRQRRPRLRYLLKL